MDWGTQHALTQRFLIPALRNLEALFYQLRASLDSALRQAQSTKLGKPYPLGQCLEISLAMQELLQRIDRRTLAGAAARGYAALADFLKHGGNMRQVWGDLRGEYFQNAFLAGTLYIDVSNDTVTRTKPPVEILPFADTRFKPVEDYCHFAKLASRYWKAHIFPNHVVPSLAPYFPLISVIPNGGIEFQAFSDYMIAVVEAGEFRPSEAVLDVSPMSSDLFQLLKRFVADSSFGIASDPLQGRALALRNCEKYRAERYYYPSELRAKAVRNLLEANEHLACLKVQTAESSMRSESEEKSDSLAK